MTARIPTLDLHGWRSAGPQRRAEVIPELDAALRQTGMFLLAGHDIPAELTARMRATGHKFMRMTPEQKVAYAVSRPYDNGWRGLGALQASAVSDTSDRSGAPDLHEAFHTGPEHRTGDPKFDRLYYPENKWPSEVPELREITLEYTGRLNRLSLELLEILASTLGIERDFFTSRSRRATWTQNVNWYPSLSMVGKVQDGQMRVGPHTDFGTLTLLDRQQGVGGLEAWNAEDGWFKPPFVPGTLVVNLGDMMHEWTDGRWQALRHRVLAPPASNPDEELVSLVFFFEADPDTEVRPMPAPVGGGAGMPAFIAGEQILEKVGATLTLST